MSSSKADDQYLDLDDVSEIELTLMTLRKPTELKKVVDSVPKPPSAVPKNGLPIWYKLGLECKLPVPKMPAGKIVFSRGKVGEDVRRVGLGQDCPRPSFDLTDPYCHTVSYDYVPMHDPHLAHHFAQKPTRNRMKLLGYVTKDNRAVCSLKEFNQYRKYLYNRFMDRIHMEMVKLDERARDDLTLKRVNEHIGRRLAIFLRSEKAREHLERVAKLQCDEFAEKLRLAKQQEQKIQQRLQYLIEFKEKQRRERMARALEKENRIKQRVQTAAEMELRRRITMVRQWRSNEKKRLNRLKQEKEAKERRVEEEANRKWIQRVEAQNQKIQEEALLLKLYTEDMTDGARRRHKKAEIYAYNTDLHLQRIKLDNWKIMHGGRQKEQKLVRKMGREFEKSKRGVKGMSPEVAQTMAAEAMSTAVSNVGDALMTLGQARARMDIQTQLPSAPIMILEHMLETAIMVFTRRRIHLLLRDVEHAVKTKAANLFFNQKRASSSANRRKSKQPRWSIQLTAELARQYATVNSPSIAFGDITKISPEQQEEEIDFKSAKYRTPTPVPSMTKLAEVTFTDRLEDLPDPVTMARWLPERRRLLEMVNTTAKLLAKATSMRVQKGMDVTVGKVTLPRMKHLIEWGEAVEGLADAVVNNRINPDSAELRRCSLFLTRRILCALQMEMKDEKKRRSISQRPSNAGDMLHQVSDDHVGGQDFYVPGQVKGLEVLVDPEQEDTNMANQTPSMVQK